MLIFFGLVIVLVLIFIYFYNRLVALKNRIQDAWAGINVLLKKRYDLIPNLVETVKGYASHEKSILEDVTKFRSVGVNAGNMEDHAAADNMLSGALKKLFAVAENYPDLKANANFSDLQKSLLGIESEIEAARRNYNAVVRDNNTSVESFPGVIVANLFGFKKQEYFQIKNESEKEPVKVKF